MTLSYLYSEYFPMILKMVKSNSGEVEDAEDVFQEGVVVLFKKLNQPSFILNHKVKTFLYAICRNIWMVRLRTKSKEVFGIESHRDTLETDQSILKDIYKNERLLLYKRHFNRLSEACQRLIQLYLQKKSMKQISEILGFKSENYARKRNHVCKKKLMTSIKADPQYKDLAEEGISEY